MANRIRPVPMFGLGTQEKSRPANAQRRVNLYYERQQDAGDRTRLVAYKTPGMKTPFVDFGDNKARGFHAPTTSEFCFLVHGSTFYQVNQSGTTISRGTIGTSTGRVSMADNGRLIVLVDGSKGYYYDMDAPGTGITEITDADFPDGATTVTWLDSYFIVDSEDGEFHISESGSASSFLGDFATAESHPDDLLHVECTNKDLLLFGSHSIEPWAHTGDAAFPFERMPGATQEWGLAAKWSLAKFDGGHAMLCQNRQGQVIAGVMRGYEIQRISTHELEAKWRKYGVFNDATAFAYMLDGHPMYVISFPSGGETWMFDGSFPPGEGWSQLVSHGLTRHRSDLHAYYAGKNYVTDYNDGLVYELDPETYTENGSAIRWTIAGRHIFDGFKKIGISAFQLDIETGVGLASGQGSDPQVVLKVSRDGGRTFGPERWKTQGKVGKYKTRVLWRNCGRGRDFVFEASGSDPVKTAILGAGIQPRGR